jgi:exosortase
MITTESANSPTSAVHAGPLPAHSSLRLAALLPAILLVGLIVLLYAHVTAKLVFDWYTLPDFSHGFLIPFFVAFLLWDQRKTLLAIPLQPSWAGLSLVALGLLLLVVGIFGSDLFLSRLSFIVLSAGMVWTLAGLEMLRRTKFMLLVLLLAIPLPSVLFNQITFPLQLLASHVATSMLQLSGVPVLREGNVLTLAAMQLEVAEACSGIRSMMSLFTVAVLFGYFFEATAGRRAFLALCSLPVAVAANAIRIYGTGLCVQYWNPDKAIGFFHEFSGWLMFLVSLTCLYLIHLALRLGSGSRARRPA